MKKLLFVGIVASLLFAGCGIINPTCPVPMNDKEKSEEAVFFKQLWDSGDAMFTFIDSKGRVVSMEEDSWEQYVHTIEFYDGSKRTILHLVKDTHNISILLDGNMSK